MIALLILSFFETSSVATAERLGALWVNPAGLSAKSGLSFMALEAPDGRTYEAALSVLGFAYARRADTGRSYNRFAASFPLTRGLFVGVSSEPGGSARFGALFRPRRFASIGATVTADRSVRGGLALRPVREYLTLWADAEFKDTLGEVTAGLGVEPLPWLTLYASYARSGSVTAGLDLSLGRLRLGTDAASDTSFARVTPRYWQEVSATPHPEPFEPTVYLTYTLSGDYEDSPTGGLFSGGAANFTELIRSLESAGRSRAVSGVLLKMENPVIGRAKAKELRDALVALREAGVTVAVFADELDDGDYYVASAADRVALSPGGVLMLTGIYKQYTYFKGLLDKLGVVADLEKIDEYKSAVEPFTRKGMSERNREQANALLDDVYALFLEECGASRDVDMAALVDGGPYLTARAVEVGLIDTVMFEDELEGAAKAWFGTSRARVGTKKRPVVERRWADDRPVVAVIFAEGEIVNGKGGYDLLLGTKTFGDKDLCPLLKRAREDKSIRAVVLRVNSPGGSALASDKIWREAKLLAMEKPLVVSMGDVAASGGYYISAAADTIVAEPNTVTGSIGILGGKVALGGLYDKLGVTVDTLKRGLNAGGLNSVWPFTDEERSTYKRFLRAGYDLFVRRVGEGRNLTSDSVDAVGRGRVWSGTRAAEIGLVDVLGGLKSAVEIAEQTAGLKGARIVKLKPKRGFLSVGVSASSLKALSSARELLRAARLLEQLEEEGYLYLLAE